MRRLNFGAGQNCLPAPWENFDIETDIRKPLPFPIGCAQFILAEHVIEHVPFSEGLFFLRECMRILQPGGVLRLAFPDITRDIDFETYRKSHAHHYTRQLHSIEDVWNSVAIDWEHQSCWTRDMALRLLVAVGFDNAGESFYGCSDYEELNGIDGHHLAVGMNLAIEETTVIEAVR